MRRTALVTLAVVLTIAPARAGPDTTRVVFVVPGPDGFTGALRSADIDGGGAVTLIEEGVSRADAGGGWAYAIHEGADAPPELMRSPLETGDATLLDVAASGFVTDVAASSTGEVALLRFVEADTAIPAHLEGTLGRLARPIFPVLVPPDRPGGTTGTVAEGRRRSYDLLFTNDPEQELAHAEQINVFVAGSRASRPPPPDATPVQVRGTQGSFGCGASACFLDWEELGASYTVGEFGSPDDAVAFAESLQSIDELLGPGWRAGPDFGYQVPELVVIHEAGPETIFDSVEGFCECGFSPKDWDEEGERLLVILGAEGYTALHEYEGPGGGEQLLEGLDGPILDASYGPDGRPLALVAKDWGRAGQIRTLDGTVLVERARAFDAQGEILAFVSGGGRLVVRDLDTGAETVIAERAIDVALALQGSPSPEPTGTQQAEPPPGRPEEGGAPWPLVAAIGGGAFLLGAGTWALVRARRR